LLCSSRALRSNSHHLGDEICSQLLDAFKDIAAPDLANVLVISFSAFIIEEKKPLSWTSVEKGTFEPVRRGRHRIDHQPDSDDEKRPIVEGVAEIEDFLRLRYPAPLYVIL
jgi:hypothetical protein